MENSERVELTDNSRTHLGEAAKWAKFLAIAGFVFLGVIILINVFLSIAISKVMFLGAYSNPVIYVTIIMVIIYGLPTYFLYIFADNTLKAIRADDNLFLEESFKNLKNMFKYIGILTIIMIVLYVFLIVTVIVQVTKLGLGFM